MISLASCSPALGLTALDQLRGLGADSAEIAPPKADSDLQGRPCNSQAEGVPCRGTCFYRSDGTLVYWIVRAWDADGPYGRTFVGSTEMLQRQLDYNNWVEQAIRPYARYYPGLAIADNAGPSFRDFGWGSQGHTLLIPARVPQRGELTIATLSVKFYMAAAKTLFLWRRFQDDCSEARQRSPLPAQAATQDDPCSIGILSFDRGRLDSYYFPDPLLKPAADWIAAGVEDSRRLDHIIQYEAPPGIGLPWVEGLMNSPIERLPPGFLQKLDAIVSDLDMDYRAALDALNNYSRHAISSHVAH